MGAGIIQRRLQDRVPIVKEIVGGDLHRDMGLMPETRVIGRALLPVDGGRFCRSG